MNRLGTLVFAGVAIAAGAYWLTLPSQGNLPANPLVGSAEAQQAEIDTSSIVEMVQGAEDAPVEVIEYASYTCPHCAAFHEGPYKKLKADFIDTGKVRFIYREVYFDRYGLWASMVARCAGPEKFFGISDLIYKGQAEWSRAGGPAEIAEELRKIGRLAGIENDKLEACLGDATKAQTLVAWYQEHATRDDINSTPSFMINGKKVENQAYDGFKALIEAELGN
ncbi:DsbA family protein [Ruegeria pomeroyi]|jgi:protein-disulfide isomerase|uniref:Thiol:disulfide interchange protein, DsbA family n=2 Tax=Ruegeria pomeroyi TaxID=89184 RepID=Q5LMW6_RUEPO|nr:DsbA family protein [Ruegeria pomeroyi]HCE69828.1 DsbA family protein [Ruegeria sp.]AAV96672.1 thiol:disulfide interchange protein, DsbA family [Ruegeria pomeroyi DSS-3]NVK98716.1 DsbA family protein [Ruegeria pomeroyi]NVL02593.1 DsbA family protein [Ruegeria pomeroyi]QWV10209.1 DsbA family protein [Ruegeria pomeroyi]